jgi:hypothetical protein
MFFHLVKPEDVDQITTWDGKNIVDSYAFHFVTSVSPRDITFLKF